MLFAWRK